MEASNSCRGPLQEVEHTHMHGLGPSRKFHLCTEVQVDRDLYILHDSMSDRKDIPCWRYTQDSGI